MVSPALLRLRGRAARGLLPQEARDAFARAAEADTGGETDAAERLDELDGLEFEDLAESEDLEDDEDLELEGLGAGGLMTRSSRSSRGLRVLRGLRA